MISSSCVSSLNGVNITSLMGFLGIETLSRFCRICARAVVFQAEGEGERQISVVFSWTVDPLKLFSAEDASRKQTKIPRSLQASPEKVLF